METKTTQKKKKAGGGAEPPQICKRRTGNWKCKSVSGDKDYKDYTDFLSNNPSLMTKKRLRNLFGFQTDGVEGAGCSTNSTETRKKKKVVAEEATSDTSDPIIANIGTKKKKKMKYVERTERSGELKSILKKSKSGECDTSYPIIADIGTKKKRKKDVERTQRSGELELLTKSKSVKWSLELEKNERCMELEIQASETQSHGVELEHYKAECHALSTALKAKETECVKFEGKLQGLEEKIAGLGKIVSEREKTSQAYLDGLVEVMECGKRQAEDEINILKNKCMELEIQASQMLNHGAELDDYKTKCQGLSTALKAKEMECAGYEGKMKNVMTAKAALEHELENCKTTCSGMEEEITGLRKTMSEREKTLEERIAYLDELVKKMKNDENCMLVQLKNENMELECEKNRAADETEYWKKRFLELKMGLGGLQKVVGYDDICKKYMDDYSCRKTDGRINVANLAHSTGSEKVLSPALRPCSNLSSFHGKFEDVNASDTANVKNQSDHSPNVNVEKKNTCSGTEVELVSEAKQQLSSETGESCKENQDLLKQGSVTTSSPCIIDIDSEDEVIEVSDC